MIIVTCSIPNAIIQTLEHDPLIDNECRYFSKYHVNFRMCRYCGKVWYDSRSLRQEEAQEARIEFMPDMCTDCEAMKYKYPEVLQWYKAALEMHELVYHNKERN